MKKGCESAIYVCSERVLAIGRWIRDYPVNVGVEGAEKWIPFSLGAGAEEGG